MQEVYGLHNMRGFPSATSPCVRAPLMAAADRFDIQIEGKGGHAAGRTKASTRFWSPAGGHGAAVDRRPQRRSPGVRGGLVCSIQAGNTFNVIPQHARLLGTVRTLTDEVRDLCETRIRAVVESVCAAYGATVKIEYNRATRSPATTGAGRLSCADRRPVGGEGAVDADVTPLMGAEDFSYMLEQRPGAYIFSATGIRRASTTRRRLQRRSHPLWRFALGEGRRNGDAGPLTRAVRLG